jgi:hypothetical protein
MQSDDSLIKIEMQSYFRHGNLCIIETQFVKTCHLGGREINLLSREIVIDGISVTYSFEINGNNYTPYMAPSICEVRPDGSREYFHLPEIYFRDTEEGLVKRRCSNIALEVFQSLVNCSLGAEISLDFHLFNPYIRAGKGLFEGPFIPEGGLTDSNRELFKVCKS